MAPWRNLLDKQQSEIIGEIKTDLLKSTCLDRECKLGNFIADAMVYAFSKSKADNYKNSITANVAITISGRFKTSLHCGNISYGHFVTLSPFENRLVAFNIPGPVIIEALEYSVSQIDLTRNITRSRNFLQVSGLKVIYDLGAPNGQRVQRLLIRCQNCSVPRYEKYDEKRLYRLITTDFIAGGGSGFTMFQRYATEIQEGITDIGSMVKYLSEAQPLSPKIEHRISIINSREEEVF